MVNTVQPKTIAAIPCLNEESFIQDIVIRSKKYVDEVIVIDDGSTDNTSQAALEAGAQVIQHEVKQGAGAATRTGFLAAQTGNADVLVTLDGDGQHNPDDIQSLITPVIDEDVDLVIGSRFIGAKSSIRRYRKFGIDVITWLCNVGSKVKITDSQCCFRAHSKRLLDKIDITENGFGFSIEVIIKARKMGLTIAEVPISCIYHSQGSSMNPITHGLGVALDVIKHRIKTLS
jgi:glycosyltransferase involved in cell wall biosynthesis